MNKNSSIYVAGHTGLVGSAVLRELTRRGYRNILVRTREELDLTRQDAVERFFAEVRPEYVFLAAAKVGGIMANSTYPADFITDNLIISSNIITAAYRYGAAKLLNLGSSCIYPKLAPQPLKEEYLLSGPLEPTNEAYAVAKIAAIKMCSAFNRQYGADFVSVMPTNLYGPRDNFDPVTSHVLPGLIRKFHEGKVHGGPVVLWGDGTPKREFLYSEDLAEILVDVMERIHAGDAGAFINIGTGQDITISELAGIIKEVTGYSGELRWDTDKPNGTPKKLLDVTRMHDLGLAAGTPLRGGIEKTYRWFLENEAAGG